MSVSSSFRMTPWVGRLMIANAVVQLLRLTIFTSDRVMQLLAFTPDSALRQPWTFLTYAFVHQNLLHLAFNMFGLFVFGSAVEERMGGRSFLLYYLYCSVGAAAVSLALSGIFTVPPFIGASGAILGVGLAFARFWPDAEIFILPLPLPIKAKTLLVFAALWNLSWALLFPHSGTAHLAHLGGLVAGYLFFRLQFISRRSPAAARRQIERVVMAQSPARQSEQPISSVRSIAHQPGDPDAAEVDRVLDKISATGIASLTPEERRFLNEVSQRKKQDLH
ncbi:MAG: rhomboid family intramembrane serine protease [Acidobacteria bacterium]|nr:rhomboid family intramembrane serine protease [Acidobacteriota bacterium]